VFVRGQVDRNREEPQIRTSEVLDVNDGRRRFTSAIVLRLQEDGLDGRMLEALRKILAGHPGPLPVYLEMANASRSRTLIRVGDNLRVSMNESLERSLSDLLGADHLVLTANGHGVMVEL